jgi:16S rRNA (cytosine1402-N4)-methyltransferase
MRETTDLNLSAGFVHVPVLSRELIEGLRLRPGGHYLDATVGGGGHSSLILAAAPNLRVTAIDRDGSAIAAAKIRLGDRGEFWQGNFADYNPNTAKFDGIIADLGVSSPQLDTSERGFSFQQEAALDMRMDRNQSLTAAQIINHWDEKQLADLIYQYGEERFSRRIAKRIVEMRPLHTTTELAGAIAAAVPRQYRYGRIHPATRTFQALRIAVNAELESLSRFLAMAPAWLEVGGRIGIISFHSLEDRIVKQNFRNCPLLQVVTKKPITAQPEEIAQNPRARSAKLRLAERI